MGAHKSQRYGDLPYHVHLDAVVAILKEHDATEQQIAAGWLHDVIEDTELIYQDIEREFGAEVASLVDAVSGEGSDREAHTSAIYRKLKKHPAACVVKLADRIANVEACLPGDRHSRRYAREHAEFAPVVEPYVPVSMWARYLRALSRLEAA